MLNYCIDVYLCANKLYSTLMTSTKNTDDKMFLEINFIFLNNYLWYGPTAPLRRACMLSFIIVYLWINDLNASLATVRSHQYCLNIIQHLIWMQSNKWHNICDNM